MQKIYILPAVFSAVLLIGCATAQDYGNVMNVGNNKYQIISQGSSESNARAKAIKAAELQCKASGFKNGFSVQSQKVNYTGMFASGQQQKAVSGILGVAGAVMDAKQTYDANKTSKSGVSAGVAVGSASDVKGAVTENSYEAEIVVICQ